MRLAPGLGEGLRDRFPSRGTPSGRTIVGPVCFLIWSTLEPMVLAGPASNTISTATGSACRSRSGSQEVKMSRSGNPFNFSHLSDRKLHTRLQCARSRLWAPWDSTTIMCSMMNFKMSWMISVHAGCVCKRLRTNCLASHRLTLCA